MALEMCRVMVGLLSPMAFWYRDKQSASVKPIMYVEDTDNYVCNALELVACYNILIWVNVC